MSDSREMVVVEEGRGMVEMWPLGCANYLTCLGDSPADTHALEVAMSPAPALLSKQDGKVIRVVGWMIHRVERLNKQTGEIKPGRRMVLICEDGTQYRTSSGPAASFIGFAVSRRGLTGFSPPLNLLVTMVGPPGEAYISLTHTSVKK